MKQILHSKWFIAAVAVVAALAVLAGGFLLVAKLLVPTLTYRKAENLVETGDYEQAYALFRSLGNFRDAKDRLDDFLWVCDSYTVDDAVMGTKVTYNYTYDEAGNLSEKLTTVNGKTTKTAYTYDDKGNELSCVVSDADGITSSEKTTYQYDANGNVVSAITVTMEDLSTEVLYAYDARGNRIWALKTVGNGTSEERTYVYDEQDNLIEARHGDRVRFLYDTDGNLTEKISLNKDGKNIGTYKYDKQGKLVSMTSEASDATIVCKINRKGRILEREYQNFTPSSKETYAYDRKGNIKEAVVERYDEETARIEYAYTYSKEGDVLTETVVEGEQSHVNRWTYDAYGNVLESETAQKTTEASGWRVFLRTDADETPFARSVMFEFADAKSTEMTF